MAISLYIPGGPIQLSGNPIWIRLTGAAPPVGSSNYKLMLKVISADNLLAGGPFFEAIAPDSSGEALFDISGLIDQPFTPEFHWPVTGAVTDHPASVFNIEFECGEVYINSSGALVTDLDPVVDTLIALKGGVSDFLACEFLKPMHSFYIDWLNAGKFLTNQPNNTVVALNQIVKLWFMRNVEISEDARWNLDIELTNCELSLPPGGDYTYKLTENITIYGSADSPFTARLIEFSINPEFNGFPQNISGSITRFTFWLSLRDAGNTEISERRTFIVDSNYHENNNYLFALNSLSGVDNIWLNGAVEKSIETVGTEGIKPKGYSTDTRIGTIVVTSRSSRRKWKINTGFKSTAEIAALVDVYLSTKLWLYIDGQLIPVILTNGDKLINNSMDDIHSVDLEFMEAHNSRFV